MTDFRDDMTPEVLEKIKARQLEREKLRRELLQLSQLSMAELEQIKAQLLEREKLRRELLQLSQLSMAEKLGVKRWAVEQVLRGRPPRKLSDEDVRLINLMQDEKEAIEERLSGLTIRAIAKAAGCSMGIVGRMRDAVCGGRP